MAAAIIEFNSLPDPVRPASQNYDLRFIAGFRFVLFLIRRVHVRSVRFKFRSACIDALINRSEMRLCAPMPNSRGGRLPQLRKLLVAGSHALGFAQQVFGNSFDGHRSQTLIDRHNFLHLVNEPRIDLRQLDQFLYRKAALQRDKQPVNPIRPRRGNFLAQ